MYNQGLPVTNHTTFQANLIWLDGSFLPSVVDPDSVGSAPYCRIRIRIYFNQM
jgi:hypothetical protein